MKTIAVEDMITVVCETFVEMLDEVGYSNSASGNSLHDWYMKTKTDAERREISELLLDKIESDMKEMKK